MSFDVAADAYDRFMGRYSVHLSAQMADLAGVADGQRVLDVGCGPGVLVRELVARVGADRVAAVDPSEPFVEAARARHPGVTVEVASAESLPFTDDAFDASLAQLVVSFMADPVGGLREMARVTRQGGAVVACVWDLAGDRAPLSPFWRAARDLDPAAEDESGRPGARDGHLVELMEAAGLRGATQSELAVTVEHATFEEWWEPYTLGVGPAGGYLVRQDPATQERLRERCREMAGPGPIRIVAYAWAASGRV